MFCFKRRNLIKNVKKGKFKEKKTALSFGASLVSLLVIFLDSSYLNLQYVGVLALSHGFIGTSGWILRFFFFISF
jgi:hypothetical protein